MFRYVQIQKPKATVVRDGRLTHHGPIKDLVYNSRVADFENFLKSGYFMKQERWKTRYSLKQWQQQRRPRKRLRESRQPDVWQAS